MKTNKFYRFRFPFLNNTLMLTRCLYGPGQFLWTIGCLYKVVSGVPCVVDIVCTYSCVTMLCGH